jgi:paraquat-inducible protein B
MKQPNKSLIGFFILTGFTALIGMSLYLAGDRLFSSDEEQFVMYFDESVKGLNVGSPVFFEGVKVGEVSRIIIVAHKDLTFSIPVFVRMDEQQKSLFGGGHRHFSYREELMQNLIEKGLRARLGVQSFLTGQLMIELTMLPETPVNLRHFDNPKERYDNKVIEIPTVLSDAGALTKSLRDYPIGKTLESFNNILDSLNKQVPVLLKDMNTFVNNADSTVKNIDTAVQGVGTTFKSVTDNVNKTVKDFDVMAKSFDKTAKAVDKTVQSMETVIKNKDSDLSLLMENANNAMVEISGAARSLKVLTDYLERHPEALLRGKGKSDENK